MRRATESALFAAVVCCIGQVAACGRVGSGPSARTDASPGPRAVAAVAAVVPVALDLDGRGPLALVREIADARHGDQDTIDDRYARVRASWEKRRFRWEMAYSRSLCRSASWCAVTVFDRLRTPGALNQGWLPLLQMPEAEHARLRDACPEHATCGAIFEGTLRTFSLTSVEPTSLVFEDVRLVRALPTIPTFGAPSAARR